MIDESPESPRDDKTPVLEVSKKGNAVTSGELKEITKTEKLKITPAMIVWVNTAVKLVSDSPSDISPICHISRDSWYRWLKLPGFLEWFGDEWKARRRVWVPQLDKIGMDRARKSYDYWSAMNRKAGDPIDHEGNVTNITGDKVIAILGSATNNIKQRTQPLATDTNDIIEGEANNNE